MSAAPIGVYLLAAGHGRRAGGPKAWREVDGRSLLERHVTFLSSRAAFRAAISVQPGWLERCRTLGGSPSGVTWVAVDPDRAPLASLIALLAAVPLDVWSFVYHVDMPLWDDAPFDRLLEARETAGDVDAIVPVFEGRGGHPVLLSPRVAGALAGLDPDADRLDHWLRERRVYRVDVDMPIVGENWNLSP